MRIAELEAALWPFATTGRGVPENWPANVVLLVDRSHEGGRGFLNSHALDMGGEFPVVSDYRRAASLLPSEILEPLG